MASTDVEKQIAELREQVQISKITPEEFEPCPSELD